MGCNNSKPKREETNINAESGSVEINVEPVLSHYKHPSPSKEKRKKDFFNSEKLQGTVQRATSVPYTALETYEDLLEHLLKGIKTEIETAWTLYNWLVYLDVNDHSLPTTTSNDTPIAYIKHVADNEEDAATFYTILCRRCNIHCVTINGITKKDSYEIGTSEREILQSRDKWNAIYLKDSWHLVHPRIGRKAKDKSGKAYFFLVDPEELITWCLPDLKEWQLLKTTLNLSDYNNVPYCQPKFFQMGLKVIQPKFAKNKAKKGKATVKISALDRTLSHKLMVKYTLRCVRYFQSEVNAIVPPQNDSEKINDIQTDRSGIIVVEESPSNSEQNFVPSPDRVANDAESFDMSHDDETEVDNGENEVENVAEHRNDIGFYSEEGQQRKGHNANGMFSNRQTTEELQKFVFMSRVDSKITFEIVCPAPGVYVLDVKSQTLSENSIHSDLFLVCSFKFTCQESSQPSNCEPFPDAPDIGWGPTPLCYKFGIRPVSHISSRINFVPSEPTKIKFELHNSCDFKTEMFGMKSEGDLNDNVTHEINGKSLVVTAAIPKEGTYALKLFGKKSNGDFLNIINYLLDYDKHHPSIEKLPKRILREKLEKAIIEGTPGDIRKAITEFQADNVEDKGEVERAEQRLKFFVLKKGLNDAVQRRNPRVLEKTMSDAKVSPFAASLRDDIRKAEACLRELGQLEGYLHPIQKMEPLTVSEIRKYTNPQLVIKDVLTATCMILGEKKDKCKQWGFIQTQLAKGGRSSLKSRIVNLDEEKVPQKTIDLCEIMLETYDLNQVREASTGAAAFYQWVIHIVHTRKSKAASTVPDISTPVVNRPSSAPPKPRRRKPRVKPEPRPWQWPRR